MDYKILKVRLDLTKDNRLPVKPVQGESAVKIEFTLIHNSQPFPLTGTTVNVKFRKKDGTISLLPGVITNATAGIAEAKLTNQVLLFAGTVVGIVEVLGDAGVAKSFIFTMEVQPGVDDHNTESVDEYPALDQAFMDIQSIRNDFDAIVAGLTVDSEVILARGGKSTLNARLNDSDASLSDKAQKLKATNLVANGDFSQGITGWGGVAATLSNPDNTKLTMVGDGTVTYPYANRVMPSLILGNKIYLKAKMMTTSEKTSTLRFVDSGSNGILISAPVANTLYERSAVVTCISKDLILQSTFSTTALANGALAQFDDLVVIDLTATFGAGNEPTKEQMDRLLAEFPNSWFDGTQEILPLKTINEILGEKANKVQEAWVTPTLTNGTTGQAGNVPQYFKDQLGIVHLRGKAIQPTNGQFLFTLPVGYRPITDLKIVVSGNNAFAILRISTGGQVYLASGNGAEISLDNIRFRAEG